MSTPPWVADAVFYAIVPDRFARRPVAGPVPWSEAALEPWDAPPWPRAYKGGNLGGVTDRLAYLADLGVSAIYLTPISHSPSYHGYKPLSLLEVDPLLGGQAAFGELLEAAHRRGLRVVLDGVFNHVSWGFPPFVDVVENGERSPWRDWFLVEGWPLNPFEGSGLPANYRCWDGRRGMPQLNHRNPAVREHIIGAAEHWVRLGADGWRFDAPTDLGDASFWRELRGRLRAINPEVYLLGELWTDASGWLDGTQWDGATNYRWMFAMLRFVGGDRVLEAQLMRGTRKEPPLDAAGFAQAVEALLRDYPREHALAQLNFLDTADTPRFRTMVGDDATSVKLAALLLFTLPGAPCLLYGDEVGLQGGPDPDNRRGFPAPERWDAGCLAEHRALITLRRAHPPLRRGHYRTLLASGGVYAFERTLPGERLVVAVNAGESTATAPIGVAHGRLLHGEGQVHGSALSLPARSGAVLQA